jgi:hypothetical protein
MESFPKPVEKKENLKRTIRSFLMGALMITSLEAGAQDHGKKVLEDFSRMVGNNKEIIKNLKAEKDSVIRDDRTIYYFVQETDSGKVVTVDDKRKEGYEYHFKDGAVPRASISGGATHAISSNGFPEVLNISKGDEKNRIHLSSSEAISKEGEISADTEADDIKIILSLVDKTEVKSVDELSGRDAIEVLNSYNKIYNEDLVIIKNHQAGK